MELGLDLIALFTVCVSWALLIWVPLVLGSILVFRLLSQRTASTDFISTTIPLLVLPLVGVALKWVARGVLDRKKGRMICLALICLVFGLAQLFGLLFPPESKANAPSVVFFAALCLEYLLAGLLLVIGLRESGARRIHQGDA